MKQRSGASSSFRCSPSFFFLGVFLICGLIPCCSAATGQAVMKIVDFTSWYYRAEIAEFGSYIDSNVVYPANLMTAPDDPRLCEFPESLLNYVNRSSSVEIITPVALLVSHGGCSAHQKLRVAMEIQQKIPRVLKYVVLYNNNPDDPDEIISLQPPLEPLPSDNFEALGVLSVSTVSGSAILSRIEHLSVVTGSSPQLLRPWNKRWRLLTEFSRVNDLRPNRNDPYQNVGNNPGSFYWFRFVLFTLLIVSPCFRAGYLWWAGGGRLHFRYNEQGRLVGMIYVPPMSDWFVSTGIHSHGPAITDRLTEEQVLALPEISYKPPLEVDGEGAVGGGGEQQQQQQSPPPSPEENHDLDDAEILIRSGSADANDDPKHKEEPDSQTITPASSDEEQPADLPPSSSNYETSCTTCSICIDDFESGEIIRILPKCCHAYHLDCIMPWLTERQGCCPLCKTSVLGEVEPSPEEVTGEGGRRGQPRPDSSTNTPRGTLISSDPATSSDPRNTSMSVPSVAAIEEVSNDDLTSRVPRSIESTVSDDDVSAVLDSTNLVVSGVPSTSPEKELYDDIASGEPVVVQGDTGGDTYETLTNKVVRVVGSPETSSAAEASRKEEMISSSERATVLNDKTLDVPPKEGLSTTGVSNATFATTDTTEAFSDFNGSVTQDADGLGSQSGDSVMSF